MIYVDNVKGEITIPIKSEYFLQFAECLLESGYLVKMRDDGNVTEVTIRRE